MRDLDAADLRPRSISTRHPRGRTLGLWLTLTSALGCRAAATGPATEPATATEEAVDPARAELEARLAWIEQELEQARVDGHIPGMAVAIVRGDEIIFAKGFGHADLEAGTPVTPETRFAIGSTTKAFSSALVAMMVDEGKLDWDDPITKYIPTFQLQIDGDEDDAATIRDLLSHRAGFARMSLLWAGNAISRERVWEYASKAEPVDPFRDDFHYNNVTYMAGSLAAAEVAGMPWEALVRTRIFEPLGMTHTNTSYDAAQADSKMAKGYSWRDDLGKQELETMRRIDLIGPAGSINSDVLDMAKWIRLQLGEGEFEGQRLVSKRQLFQTRRAIATVAPGQVDYGMGWFVREWEEKQIIEHGGNIDGFAASVALLPEEDLGVVILTNISSTPLQQLGYMTVFRGLLTDAYTRDPNPTGEDLSGFEGRYLADFASFAGQFFEVSRSGEKLALKIPGQGLFTLAPPDADGWRNFEADENIAVSFEENAAGEVATLVLHQGEMSFEMLREGAKVPAEIDADAAGDRLGRYTSDKGVAGDVIIHNGRLAFDIDKQMAFDLEPPEADGEYHFRANYEMFIVFDHDKKKKEKIVGLTLFDKGQVLKFERGKPRPEPTLEAVHAKRRTEKRQAALEAAGIVRFDQTVEVLSGGLTAQSQLWFDAKGSFRQEIQYGEAGELGRGVTILHDGRGWSESTLEPARELDGVLLTQLQLGHPNSVYGDWRRVFDGEAVGRSTEDGRWAIELSHEGLPDFVYFVDPKTGDVVEIAGFESSGSGIRIAVRSKFSDYRKVEALGGLRVPFRAEVSNSQTGKMVATLTTIEPGLADDPQRFAMPDAPNP